MKEHVNSIILCLFELVVGILLLVDPVSFTSGIILVAGIALMILGLVEVIKYFRTSPDEAVLGQALAKGLISLLVGGFCVFNTKWFIATFPILAMIYGVIILVTGIGRVQLTVDMIRHKNKKWFWAAIGAIVSVACAVVILNKPFTTTKVLWIFTGVSLIVESVLDIVTIIVWGKAPKGNIA